MRIGIDARELCGHPTGAGRYLGGLLQQWSSSPEARRHEFVLYAPARLGVALDGRRFPTRVVGGPGGTWWEQVQMPAVAARDHLDVFFAPAYTSPLFRRLPSVVAIHDVSFAARPDWFSTREGIRRRWFSRQAALSARSVITISHFSRGEIIDRFGIPEPAIHVIPPGITPPAVTRDPADPRRPSLNLLFVGTILNRRNVPHLIRAVGPLARRYPAARLDIVGDNRSYPRQELDQLIALEGLSERVRWRAWVPDDELAALYGQARAFAFLSEYEGLGLTPLEALAVGVPPVLFDTPVARESCGDAALYIAPGDLEATTKALESILVDESIRGRLLAAAPGVLARYDWPRAARDTLAVIERATGTDSSGR